MKLLLVGGSCHGSTHDVASPYSAFYALKGCAYKVTPETITVEERKQKVTVAIYEGCSDLETWELSERILNAIHLYAAKAVEQIGEEGVQSVKCVPGLSGPNIPNIVGEAADKVPGADKRTVAGVVGRLLEEAVELALEAGLPTGEIYAHVTDSIYNQYVKASKVTGSIIYPSTKLDDDPWAFRAEVAGEIGDVAVMLMDVAHRAGIDYEAARQAKIQSFITKVDEGKFYANDKGLLYVRKPHMDFKNNGTE
jgi:NTP pyrophosphatase (non-canonical NTP hydrolase)